MRTLILVIFSIVLTCAAWAQVNYVKNPGFEEYKACPEFINRINYCSFWSIPGDSTTILEYCAEYYNVCGNSGVDLHAHVPDNLSFYQLPHSGNGFSGGHLFYDKNPPAPPGILPFNYRDNIVGRLYQNLEAGKLYCVSFWVNMAEISGLGHNKIGAYLDDGRINKMVDTFGQEINVRPQVYTNEVIIDTLNWTKIEGSFRADGTEHYISIGNFFPNDSVSTVIVNYLFLDERYSYYLIDDVSVVATDAKADAGPDRWVELGKTIQIGPVEDSTARGMDCKWYRQGALIDSGNVIRVAASGIRYAIDTYIVVQTLCGIVTRDTMLLSTVPLGIKEHAAAAFNVYPNPSNGAITLTLLQGTKHAVAVRVYDLPGRLVYEQGLLFSKNEALMDLNVSNGIYILELADAEGNISRQRIEVRK